MLIKKAIKFNNSLFKLKYKIKFRLLLKNQEIKINL